MKKERKLQEGLNRHIPTINAVALIVALLLGLTLIAVLIYLALKL